MPVHPVHSFVVRVVFLGDSITFRGDWAEWFPDLPTANLGVGGQTVGDLSARLDVAITDPRAVSLLIGTNDLDSGGTLAKPDAIAEQFDSLVRRIRQMAPSAPVFVNSVFPRSLEFRERIKRLNALYALYALYALVAAEHAATYIDVWPAVATVDGEIRSELSPDNIHLNAAGYGAWVDVLRPHLAGLAIP